ncbi:response regulator transcription factor [Paenibacillus sp. BSR1-1]|uniref:response regulator transcription factor n=1 Tax=Paenibacillus sp. BSR1-1 TaxID=3020845 RepID=UPI0025B0A969|nr:response regulator transcription factor [Paenibacillus sp. BSR1-1]MDN3017286.1 response regulator transcription factor [Paenibacillus sp. BSR1-1]
MTAVNQCRTLIVDDEMLIRQGIKHYIDWEKEGFTVVGEASNGQEALELIESANPHIIITDIVMPIMDGEELTRIVKERYPQIEIIILSSFGEFDYVRSTFQNGVVDYILKPKLDAQILLKALKTASSRIPAFQKADKQADARLSIGQIIQKLISGYEANFDVGSVSEAFPYSHYCLLGVDLKKQQTDILKKLEEALLHSIGQVAHYSYSVDLNIQVLLLNVNEENITEVMNFASTFAIANPGIGLVLTEEFLDFSQIGTIYKESLLKLINYRFYFPQLPFLSKKDLPELPIKKENFNLDWFTEEFKRKNFDAAIQNLHDHVSFLSKCYTTDVYEYKAFFGNIIFNITILLSNMEYNVKQLEDARYSYFKSIENASNAVEVATLLNQFIEEAKTCIISTKTEPDNLNMKKIMEYIRNHYAEPITLKDVAKQFHFNPSYLSNYFSTHNNKGFIEYLNKIRIEEAAKLLIQGTVSISEISGMVGYSDHSYFCKVFKKIKGVSPSQYKRKQTLR